MTTPLATIAAAATPLADTAPGCRFCGSGLQRTFADLGMSPLANALVPAERLALPEIFYPLHARVCDRCRLVQLPELASPSEIFSDYPYFSSYSDSWLAHARTLADTMITRRRLGPESLVVELASNDGYLLQYFRERGIPVLGIEPAANVAATAVERGISTLVEFFGRDVGRRLANDGRRADLLVANNVLAHVPNLNDFVAGIAELLAADGTASLEFPHLLRLVAGNQFDTIYHEHFSYFSFGTVREVFAAHGLEVFDVEELGTHGGSIRIHARRSGSAGAVSARVGELLAAEERAGMLDPAWYEAFGERVRRTKRALLRFLLDAHDAGKTVVGYGAPAKGNTLLTYCGIGPELLAYTVDRSPHKQGRWLPGSRIPVHAPERIAETRPDYVLILPWNLRDEIARQMAHVREWGGRFVVAIPEVAVW